MSDKSMDQFLFEYEERPDTRSYDDMSDGPGAQDSFTSIKDDLGSYRRMLAILAGEEKFEYSLLDSPKMVRALVDQIKVMSKNRDRIREENSSISKRIKQLEKIEFKTPQERDELLQLQNKDKAYQLQKTLMNFDSGKESTINQIDDILKRIENKVEVTDKTIEKYEKLVSEIEDAIFQETYVRKNLAYDRGEASANMKKPTATDNFPVKFIAANGSFYYGIVRPPSGIITWEGSAAREAWLTDPQVISIFTNVGRSNKYSRDEMLKLRLDKDTFTVLSKEQLNDKMSNMKTENGLKKFEYRDDANTKQAVRSFIFNDNQGGDVRSVTDHSVMAGSIDDVIGNAKTKVVQTSLDPMGRPRGLTDVIDSIEFWRFIRGLF